MWRPPGLAMIGVALALAAGLGFVAPALALAQGLEPQQGGPVPRVAPERVAPPAIAWRWVALDAVPARGVVVPQARPESSWQGPPVIARGDRVTAVSGQGAVRIEARARALQAGRPGREVLVRIDGATAPVWARVVQSGWVELQ